MPLWFVGRRVTALVADDRGCGFDSAFGFADQAFDGDQLCRTEGAELGVEVVHLLPRVAEVPGQRGSHCGGDARVDLEGGDALTQGGETVLQRRFFGAEVGRGDRSESGSGVHMVLWLQ